MTLQTDQKDNVDNANPVIEVVGKKLDAFTKAQAELTEKQSEFFKEQNAETLEQVEKLRSEFVEQKRLHEEEILNLKRNSAVNDAVNQTSKEKQVFLTAIKSGYGSLTEQDKDILVKQQMSFVEKGKQRSEHEVKDILSSQIHNTGWVIPAEMDRTITKYLNDSNALYREAEKKPTTSNEYVKHVRIGQGAAYYDGEVYDVEDNIPNYPKYLEIKVPINALLAHAPVSQDTLDDSIYNIEAELTDAFSVAMSEASSSKFILGEHEKAPRGILRNTFVLQEDKNSFKGDQVVGSIKTGVAQGLGDPETLVKKLYELKAFLKSGYAANAKWLMNSTTVTYLFGLTGSDGQLLYQNSLADSAPDRLLGKPIIYDENMPDVKDTILPYPLLFGDFRRAYLIAERAGMIIMRDVKVSQNRVIFVGKMRHGGRTQNYEAFKALTTIA